MTTQFRDRTEAGQALATRLTAFTNRPDVLVLALPRGGVPVAAEVAKKLNAPLDVFVVRKLGLPEHPELAMGAIATGGVRVLNRELVEGLRIPEIVIDVVTAQEQEELARRQRMYRGNLPSPNVKAKTVILVDDGVATGSTMMAAIEALRQLHAGRIVVAAPVIAHSTFYEIHDIADDVATVIAPEEFHGVGQFYEDFSQTTDREVRQLLAETNHRAQTVAA
jgi:putative phosphoribosyl transferase